MSAEPGEKPFSLHFSKKAEKNTGKGTAK